MPLWLLLTCICSYNIYYVIIHRLLSVFFHINRKPDPSKIKKMGGGTNKGLLRENAYIRCTLSSVAKYYIIRIVQCMTDNIIWVQSKIKRPGFTDTNFNGRKHAKRLLIAILHRAANAWLRSIRAHRYYNIMYMICKS